MMLLAFSALPARSGLVLVGENDDISRIREVLMRCAGDCGEFDELLSNLYRDDWQVVLHVGSGMRFDHVRADSTRPFDIIFEGFLGNGVQVVDIDELERLPRVRFDGPEGPVRSAGVPEWASTDCSMLAHALAEALHGVQFREAGYLECHERGLEVENQVRACIGSSTDVDRAWCERQEPNLIVCYKQIGSHFEIVRVRDGQIESIEYVEEIGADANEVERSGSGGP